MHLLFSWSHRSFGQVNVVWNQLVTIDTANSLENQLRKTLPKATGGIRNMNVIDCPWDEASGATDCAEREGGKDVILDGDSTVGQDYSTLRDSTAGSSYSAMEGLNSWPRIIPPLMD